MWRLLDGLSSKIGLGTESSLLVVVLAVSLQDSDLTFRVLFSDSGSLFSCFFGGYVSVEDVEHIIGHFSVPVEHIQHAVPFTNQIFVVDGGQLGCDFADGIIEEGDGFGVHA